jgi:hypothetical protein
VEIFEEGNHFLGLACDQIGHFSPIGCLFSFASLLKIT